MNGDLFSEMTFVPLCTSGGLTPVVISDTAAPCYSNKPSQGVEFKSYYLSLLAVSHQAT